MTFKITPQEMQRMESRAHLSIRTKVPKEEIDDRGLLILPRLRGSGLSAGDHVLVQCMNNDYSELLHEAEFALVSVKVVERLSTSDDYREGMVKETTYRLARRSEWWDVPGVGAAQSAAPSSAPAASPHKAKVAA